LFLLLILRFFLTLYREHIVAELDLDILQFEAWKFRRDLKGIVCLGYIHARNKIARAALEEAAPEIVKQHIDFILQQGERIRTKLAVAARDKGIKGHDYLSIFLANSVQCRN